MCVSLLKYLTVLHSLFVMVQDAEMATRWEAVSGEDLGTVTQTQAATDLLMVVKEGQPLLDHS